MVVASQHNRAYLAPAHHLVEAECNLHASFGILIEDTRLRAHHQIILFGIANPIVIIQVLPATRGVDTLHCRPVGLHQVFVPATETHPAERPVTVIKEFGAHDVFHIAGEDEPVLITAVARYFGDAGIVDGFHKGVAVIEEVRAPPHELFYGKKMAFQRGIHLTAEFRRVLVQHPGALLKGQPCGTVAAVVGGMAGCLVG